MSKKVLCLLLTVIIASSLIFSSVSVAFGEEIETLPGTEPPSGIAAEDPSASYENQMLPVETRPVSKASHPVLTVIAISNFFGRTDAYYDEYTDEVVVTYYLRSMKRLQDTQWEIRYDSSVLTFDPEKNTAATVCPLMRDSCYIQSDTENDRILFEASSLRLFDFSDKQAVFAPTVEEMEAEAADLGFEGENIKYALAWIKLWCEQYHEETDDGPICTTLVDKSAAGQCGLLVYSKLRSVEESESVSVNNVTVAAYQDDYEGFGGYAYKHYMMIPKATQYPWTACAFIAYITTTQEGFKAWGKDMGGYAPVPACMQDHSKDGNKLDENGNRTDEVEFAAKNDRGYDWWLNEGKLIVEDPAYCASVADTMGDWIDLIIGMK